MNYIKSNIVAKGIKKAMKVYGVKVLRCQQNGAGALITIKNTPDNKNRAMKFFNEFELAIYPNITPCSVSASDDYLDFGTMYHYVKA